MSGSMRITSLSNPRIKQAAALEQRKERRERGLFLAEGVDVLASARAQGWAPVDVFFSDRSDKRVDELVGWAEASGARCEEASPAVLAKLSTRDNPQAVVATFRTRWHEPGDVRSGVWIGLEGVRDPGNLGTIVRTVDAVGAAGVLLIGACCDPYAREAVRASMGSVFAVPLVRATPEELTALRARWTGAVVGTHLKATTDFRQAYPVDTLILMGNESTGLSDATTALCTQLVRIPMQGQAESLNLAIASALMLYSVVKI